MLENNVLDTMASNHAHRKDVSPRLLLDIYLVNLEVARESRLRVRDDDYSNKLKSNTATIGIDYLSRAEAVLELGVISGLVTRSDFENRLNLDHRPIRDVLSEYLK